MEAKERKKRIEEMVADLESRNERRVIGALKRIPHEGSPEMVKPMFRLYLNHPSKEVRILLEKTVHNLKDPASVDPMIDLLRDAEAKPIHKEVLNALWLSGLDVADELGLLVELAVNGDYMVALEVTTVIENLEFDNDTDLTDAIARMDEAVQHKGEKQDLLVSLRQLLLDKLLGGQ